MFKKREIFKVKSVPVDPAAIESPTTAQDFVRRGMAYYARKSYAEAEKDLRQAITLDAKEIEGHYRLGMVFKAMKKKEDSIREFKTVIDLLEAQSELSPAKYEMMHRLALGHMNEVSQGDWNLEKEIWQHTQ
jgi:tetratricopeptide (TPR) repeat protein